MRGTWIVVGLALAAGLTGCIGDPTEDPGVGQANATPGAENGTATPGSFDWAAPGEADLRPGSSLGGYCTFNFLFTSTTNHTAYVGTAGHCTEGPGETVELGSGTAVGEVVFDSDNHTAPAEMDFSLVELDASLVGQANPAMQGHEGPTGVLDPADASRGDGVDFYGYGVVLGQAEQTRPRSGVLVEITETTYRSDMPAVNGDSGSPIVHAPSGTALGIVSHYGISNAPPTTDEGPTMAFILDELAKVGWDVELAQPE